MKVKKETREALLRNFSEVVELSVDELVDSGELTEEIAADILRKLDLPVLGAAVSSEVSAYKADRAGA